MRHVQYCEEENVGIYCDNAARHGQTKLERLLKSKAIKSGGRDKFDSPFSFLRPIVWIRGGLWSARQGSKALHIH